MGTEKKLKSGSELPKGLAASSCKPSASCLPGALPFSGSSPKRVPILAPGWLAARWVSQRPLHSPATASSPACIHSSCCGVSWIKSSSWHPWSPVLLAQQGGRGLRPGQGSRGGKVGTQLTSLLWVRPQQAGTSWRVGGEDKTQRAWRCPVASHLSLAWPQGFRGAQTRSSGLPRMGAGEVNVPRPSIWQPALGQGELAVPRGDRSDFRERLGEPRHAPPPHGCSPTGVTSEGSKQFWGACGRLGKPLEHSQASMCTTPTSAHCPQLWPPVSPPPQQQHPKGMGDPIPLHQPLPSACTSHPSPRCLLSFFFFSQFQAGENKNEKKKILSVFLASKSTYYIYIYL